jgi:hypothetical protein
MRRVLDIEFFLVRLPASSATLEPAPGLLLDQPPNEQPDNRLLNLKRRNSGALAQLVRMAGAPPEALEDRLFWLAQIAGIARFFGFLGLGRLFAIPRRRRLG